MATPGLAAAIERFAPGDGVHETAVPRLAVTRVSEPGEPVRAVHEPALCVVAQGVKEVILGDALYRYDPAQYLVVSYDLPITGRVVQATRAAPYLSLRLDFAPGEIASLLLETGAPFAARKATARGLFVADVTPPLLDALLRLMHLLDTPGDIPALAPLAVREILYRLLKSEHGWRLAQIATGDSHAQRIARAIGWLKAHFAERLRIEDLARSVHMSTSSLHHHFKAVTALSPLQFQKHLRLQEARRLLLSGSADAASAGYSVGYESQSQFSREYSRLFGAPPRRDVERLKQLEPA